MVEDEIDFVCAFEEPLPRGGVDRKRFAQAEAIAHFAALEIDRAAARARAMRYTWTACAEMYLDNIRAARASMPAAA